ncbi:hypothetical protein MC7420_5664 [Coleofasciculus chthonoplastes PCC 7420]|uniref:Uncharacterized protein n=1 Tax=Coleofasciculus chthonoplastes PCC 7420 TaxID=118168 RepID=B4VPJ2_9CYAN|nr:hypothetical protein MC7420_5664 [Coleofasciculus chthonoplastes PCC 7420]
MAYFYGNRHREHSQRTQRLGFEIIDSPRSQLLTGVGTTHFRL